MVHGLPNWNWQGRESQEIPVMVYSNAEEVELLLNGKSLGRKKTLVAKVALPVGPNISASREFASKYRLLWPVPFQQGALTAIGYTAGKEVARDEVSTAGAPPPITGGGARNILAAEGERPSVGVGCLAGPGDHLL